MDRIYKKSFQIFKIYKISIILNLYQNQESYSSGSSFNQIDINAFNTDAAFWANNLKLQTMMALQFLKIIQDLVNNLQLVRKIKFSD